jgi:hypothetical protein
VQKDGRVKRAGDVIVSAICGEGIVIDDGAARAREFCIRERTFQDDGGASPR